MKPQKTKDVTRHLRSIGWVFLRDALQSSQTRPTAQRSRISTAADALAVDVHIQVVDDALQAWTAGEEAEARAREAQAAAAVQKRNALVELKNNGLSATDAGRVVGISKQRVYQLLSGARSSERARTGPLP